MLLPFYYFYLQTYYLNININILLLILFINFFIIIKWYKKKKTAINIIIKTF